MQPRMHVHLIGIGGSGLSAIAQVLLERGYRVSGSDRQPSPVLERLQQAGAQVFIGHHAEQIAGADLVVRSSAVAEDNPEVQAAHAAGLAVLKRADLLDQLIGEQLAVAIAGAHGKTTTTAMIAWILAALGQDPSYVIGSVHANLGSSAHAGQGRYFVIEADEYDGMFWGLHPLIAVVTNIEHDHPDCYPTAEDFYEAFLRFAENIQPGGTLVGCLDDPGAARLLREYSAANGSRAGKVRTVTYALDHSQADYRAIDLEILPDGRTTFEFVSNMDYSIKPLAHTVVTLQVPGLHNVRNALAALVVARLLDLPANAAAHALSEYRGASRRFDIRGEVGDVLLIDDYAHHPTEIRATLAAARQRFPNRRIWAVWQPHTYSRTRTLFAGYLAAFNQADRLLVTEVYAAREQPPEDGFSARQVVDALASGDFSQRAFFTPQLSDALALLESSVQAGDVVIVLSAGDADQVTAALYARLSGGSALRKAAEASVARGDGS